MRRFLATAVAWVAMVLYASAMILTSLAEWIHRPRPAAPAEPPGAPPGHV